MEIRYYVECNEIDARSPGTLSANGASEACQKAVDQTAAVNQTDPTWNDQNDPVDNSIGNISISYKLYFSTNKLEEN